MKGYVYFGQMSNGAIKIGFTTDIETRLYNLHYMVPGGVELLAKVNALPAGERWLHDRFRHLKITGEWFRPEDELLSFVADCLRRGNLVLPAECRAETIEPPKRIEHTQEVEALCREYIKQIAEPMEFGESMASALKRVSQRTGFRERRILAIWYREARGILAAEYLQLKECAEARVTARTLMPNDNAAAA